MLTSNERISNIKCKVAKNGYIKLVERNYGIETCNDEYTEEMLLDNLLQIELLEQDYDCSSRISLLLRGLKSKDMWQKVPGGIRYSFPVPSTTWTILGLGLLGFDFNPNATVLDLNNVVIDAKVSYPEYASKIVITFNDPVAGYVDLT